MTLLASGIGESQSSYYLKRVLRDGGNAVSLGKAFSQAGSIK